MVAVFVPFNTSHAEDPIINANKKCVSSSSRTVPNESGIGGATRTEGSGGCKKYEYTCPSGSTPVEGDSTKCRKNTINSTQTCVKKHYVSGGSSSGCPASGGGHEECSEYKYECPSGYKLVEGDNSKCKYQSSFKPSSTPSTLTLEQKQKATEQQLAQEQAAEGEGEKPKEECGGHVEGIGYFLCPILERLVDFADGTWGFFEYLLQTDPLPSEEDNALRLAWNGLRDVAN